MAMPEQIYTEWRSKIKSTDDSIFYYHSYLDRIILGLPIFAISSRRHVHDLGKTEPQILNVFITDLITAWIDEDEGAFKTMFGQTMTIAEAYMLCIIVAEKEYPSKKEIRKLGILYTRCSSRR